MAGNNFDLIQEKEYPECLISGSDMTQMFMKNET